MTTTLSISAPATLPAGAVIAANVSAEDYLAQYAGTFHEWVRGIVIKMSPASLQHDALTNYLRYLLDIYFELNPLGRAVSAPFVMRLETTRSFREPDIQVTLSKLIDFLQKCVIYLVILCFSGRLANERKGRCRSIYQSSATHQKLGPG